MNLVGEFMRENVKVSLPFPHQFPGLVTSTTQAFIKGARSVTLHSGMSLDECIQLELDAINSKTFSSLPLHSFCVSIVFGPRSWCSSYRESVVTRLYYCSRTVQAGSVHQLDKKGKKPDI